MSQPPIQSPKIVSYEGRDYRDFWVGEDMRSLHEQECRILREVLPEGAGWFLDIGCAHGRLTPLFDRPGRPIVLLDYSLNHLEIAAGQHAGANLHYVAADANRLPFRDESFQSILSVRVFHHMEAPTVFLDEAARVLTPGGRAVIQYANKRNPLRILRRGLSSFRHDHESYLDGTLWGTHPACFEDLARRSGFVLRRTRGTGFLDQFVRVTGLVRPLTRILEPALDGVLGPMRLAPDAYADLEKTGAARASARAGSLAEILVCPACRGTLRDTTAGLACPACGREFVRHGRILDLRAR